MLQQPVSQGWDRSSKDDGMERKERRVRETGRIYPHGCLAVHDKTAADEVFLRYLPVIERESSDNRNYVKKAVNWACGKLASETHP